MHDSGPRCALAIRIIRGCRFPWFGGSLKQGAVLVAAVLAAFAAGSVLAQSPSWPSKPITYVVPFAAGGTTDILVVAGDPKAMTREQHLRDGIPIPHTLSGKIQSICERCGASFLLI